MGIFEKIVAVILVGAQAQASVELPLVAGPSVSDAELRIRAQATDRKTLSDFFDMTRPGVENETKLRQKLERAQRAWLGGSQEIAQSTFRELADMSLRADWRESQRASLLYSHLRLAQLAASPTERNDWLTKAARIFSDLEPDGSLFPPPLIAEYVEVRAQVLAKSTGVGLREVFPGFRFAYVDGAKVSLEGAGRVRMTPGAHRITVVSDRHAPLTEEMTAAQLGVFRVKVNGLVEGCESGSKALGDGTRFEVYVGETCSSISQFKPVTAPDQSWAEVPQPVASRARRDWLWIGAIALGTAAAIAIQRNQKASNPAPVHREGF